MCISVFHQQKMEEFYNALTDVIIQKNCYIRLGPGVEEDVLYPEVLLFDTTIFSEIVEDQLEPLLQCVAARGYRIVMNFYESEVVLGNVAVKINDKWFAFGECINQGARESWEGKYVTEIWPLKQVIPNLRQMEVKLRYAIPIRPQTKQPPIPT